MSAEEILSEIRSVGGRLTAHGDRLHIDVPVGMLTPELRARLQEHKTELLRRLELDARLKDRGIAIAIDKITGCALLLFKPSDADIVRHVADVYQPFEVELTLAQRQELEHDLDYYERLEQRKVKP